LEPSWIAEQFGIPKSQVALPHLVTLLALNNKDSMDYTCDDCKEFSFYYFRLWKWCERMYGAGQNTLRILTQLVCLQVRNERVCAPILFATLIWVAYFGTVANFLKDDTNHRHIYENFASLVWNSAKNHPSFFFEEVEMCYSVWKRADEKRVHAWISMDEESLHKDFQEKIRDTKVNYLLFESDKLKETRMNLISVFEGVSDLTTQFVEM
jgi:hypothetical protein